MSISPARLRAEVVDVAVGDDRLRFILSDGRELAAPTAWFPRLRDASPEERADWRLIGAGEGVHWPAVDEDIALATLLRA